MDVTQYLPIYKMTPHELAMKMIREVLKDRDHGHGRDRRKSVSL